jgi:subfamily B ATP-binding cassette protein MsbA
LLIAECKLPMAQNTEQRIERNEQPSAAGARVSWQRLLSYVRPYWGYLLFALVGLLFGSAMGLILPLAAGQLINTVVGVDAAFQLNRVALVLVGVALVQALASFVKSYTLSFVGERVVSDLRAQAYTHLMRLPLGFFNNRRTGEITSRLTNDVTLIQATVTNNVASLLEGVITFVGALVLMLMVSWELAGLVLLVVPLVALLGVVFGRRMRRVSTRVQDKLADVSSVLEESVAGIRVVQSFAREPYEVQRFGSRVEATFHAAMQQARVRATFQPLVEIAAWGALVAVLWYGGQLVLSGALLPGDLFAFLLYAGSIAGSVGLLAGLFGQVQEALGALQRVFELIDTEPTIVDAPNARAFPIRQGRVSFEGVTFRYEAAPDVRGEAARLPVLENFSLEIAPGEMLALVGPSGAGKSTIVNLIPRFYDVQQGAVRIDGVDVREVQLAQLRGQIGIVPQETLLFSGTIRDNIRYGRLDADDAAIEAAARAANAHDFINAQPQGYETTVGERGVKLSGGQRQRIAIARAILKDPRILILDEATSALDSESEQLVQEALERLMRGRTSIVIAHRLSTVKRAERIAVIVQGQLVELGRHSDLLASGGLYARLYAMQFREDTVPDLGLVSLAA